MTFRFALGTSVRARDAALADALARTQAATPPDYRVLARDAIARTLVESNLWTPDAAIPVALAEVERWARVLSCDPARLREAIEDEGRARGAIA